MDNREKQLVWPNTFISQDKTRAAIASARRHASEHEAPPDVTADCSAVYKMPTFENEIHNTSPNATNIAGGA